MQSGRLSQSIFRDTLNLEEPYWQESNVEVRHPVGTASLNEFQEEHPPVGSVKCSSKNSHRWVP
jgi:hypothetical protein